MCKEICPGNSAKPPDLSGCRERHARCCLVETIGAFFQQSLSCLKTEPLESAACFKQNGHMLSCAAQSNTSVTTNAPTSLSTPLQLRRSHLASVHFQKLSLL